MSEHRDQIERLNRVFYIRWTSGPDYERAFLCVEDGEPDMNSFAATSFGCARIFEAGMQALSALSKEVQASEASAWVNAEQLSQIGGHDPSLITAYGRQSKRYDTPLYTTPQPLPATNRGVVTEAMVEALLSGDLVGHIVDVAITRCRALHDYSGRPAWEDAVDGAIREVVTARAAALSVPAPGTGEAVETVFNILWPQQEWNGEEAFCRAVAEKVVRALALSPSTPVGEGKLP